MSQLARGYSFVMFEYDPGNRLCPIPFPFLHREDIRAFIGEPGDAAEVTVTWEGPALVSIPESVDGATPSAGTPVTIRRITPRDTMLVDYQDGAQLPAADLNLDVKQLLYIIQESIDFGTYGGDGLPGGGTGWSDTNQPTDPAIQEIIDRIMQSEVFQTVVLDPLGGIDTTAEAVLAEILRSDSHFSNIQKNIHQITGAYHELDVVETNHSALVQQVDAINASLGDIDSSITNLNTAIVDEEHARATAVAQVEADYKAADSNIRSSVTDVQDALSDEASARASAIQQVESDYKTADTNLHTAISTEVAETYASKDYAESVAETKVDALANGAVSHIEERFDALAAGTSDPDNAFSAVWSIRMSASMDGGKPVIAGVGLGIDPQTGSSFIISADQFAIVHPNYTQGGTLASVKFPFVVGEVAGVTQVGIDGNLVVDKTIKAHHIDVDSLSALTANAGVINGGTFKTHTLNSSGEVTDPAEFRVEITNIATDPFPLWIGSGTKNQNNAVMWVDRNGNAGFDGTIQADNMTGNLQRQTLINVTAPQSIAKGGSAVIATWTLPAPVLPGQTHTPYTSVVVTNGEGGGNIQLYLEYLDGSTWVQCGYWKTPDVTGSSDAHCLSYTEYVTGVAPETGSATQFRLRYVQNAWGNQTVASVVGMCLGIR